jgi:hypothetical protein
MEAEADDEDQRGPLLQPDELEKLRDKYQLLQERDAPPVEYYFPKRGTRRCQAKWFENIPWLSYQRDTDTVVCFICCKAVAHNLVDLPVLSKFVSLNGYGRWKNCLEQLRKHHKSAFHKRSVTQLDQLETLEPITSYMSTAAQRTFAQNRERLLAFITCVKVLSAQGLPFQGRDSNETGNLATLMSVFGPDGPVKLSSPATLTEIQSLIADEVRRPLIAKINEQPCYTFAMDETHDAGNHEQATCCIRWVDVYLQTHEDFLGLCWVKNIRADTLFAASLAFLEKHNLPLSKLRGQVYDGASSMSGALKGLATQIREKQPLADYVHCFAHSLDLCIKDILSAVLEVKDMLDVVDDFGRVFSASPKRAGEFADRLEQSDLDCGNFRPLCRTRWTVKGASLTSLRELYSLMLLYLPDAAKDCADKELSARISGHFKKLQDHKFFMALVIAEDILIRTDHVSKTLQSPEFTAFDYDALIAQFVQSLVKAREDEMVEIKYQLYQSCLQKFNIEERVQRTRTIQHAFGIADARDTVVPVASAVQFRLLYRQCIDTLVASLQERLKLPPIFQHYKVVMSERPMTPNFDTSLAAIVTRYNGTFDKGILGHELEMASANVDEYSFSNYVQFIREGQHRVWYAQLHKLLQLILTMPITNAVSERSFSTLKRVKSYLRTNMGQDK